MSWLWASLYNIITITYTNTNILFRCFFLLIYWPLVLYQLISTDTSTTYKLLARIRFVPKGLNRSGLSLDATIIKIMLPAWWLYHCDLSLHNYNYINARELKLVTGFEWTPWSICRTLVAPFESISEDWYKILAMNFLQYCPLNSKCTYSYILNCFEYMVYKPTGTYWLKV